MGLLRSERLRQKRRLKKEECEVEPDGAWMGKEAGSSRAPRREHQKLHLSHCKLHSHWNPSRATLSRTNKPLRSWAHLLFASGDVPEFFSQACGNGALVVLTLGSEAGSTLPPAPPTRDGWQAKGRVWAGHIGRGRSAYLCHV